MKGIFIESFRGAIVRLLRMVIYILIIVLIVFIVGLFTEKKHNTNKGGALNVINIKEDF